MAWYKTGTISIANGSTAVVGNGTVFDDTAAGVNVGDALIVGVGADLRIYEIASVNNATSLTLATPATLDVSGSTYQIQTSVALTNQSLGKKVAATMDRILSGISNWMLILKGTGDISITTYDGSQASGKAWPTISQMVVDALNGLAQKANISGQAFTGPVKANGGLTASAGTEIDRIYLGAKTEVTGDLINKGQTVKTLAYQDQVDRTDLNPELFRTLLAAGAVQPNLQGAGVWTFNNTPLGYAEQYGVCLQVNNRTDISGAAGPGVWQHYLAFGTGGNVIYATNINGIYSARKLYSTSNTTTNSSGALVPASPVVRIVESKEGLKRADVLGTEHDEYTWASPRGLVNAESKGCTVSKLKTGEYLVKGAKSLARDLWTVMDCGNGQGRIVALAEAEETENGIIVRCFKQKYSINDEGDLTIEKGAQVDIPADTWIDIRLEMPEDSAYNLAMKAVGDNIDGHAQNLEEQHEAERKAKEAAEAAEAAKNSSVTPASDVQTAEELNE